MIDPKIIRENPDLLRDTLKRREMSSEVDVDRLIELDGEKRELEKKLTDINQARNEAAREKDIDLGKSLKERGSECEKFLAQVTQEYNERMYELPNLLSDDTPAGKDDSENVVLKKVGKPTEFDFEIKDHVELGKSLDIIDMETAAKVAGSRFTFLKGDLARIQFALVQLVFEVASDEKVIEKIIKERDLSIPTTPFTAIVPPVFVNMEVMNKMGRLHPMDERYCFPNDNQALVGSAEHSMGPMHMDEIIPEDKLPIRYIGYSTAFRREAGSTGKDVRGILRLHQFDKLEMETFSTPETSIEEQELLVGIQEEIMQRLELPYQVVQVCTGDIGKPDFRQIDIETWMPAQEVYRETHSADLMTDYQSRRLKTRMKTADGKKVFIHMNDATALAIGRVLIAIIENNQTADGTIKIPKVLQPYLGGKKEIS